MRFPLVLFAVLASAAPASSEFVVLSQPTLPQAHGPAAHPPIPRGGTRRHKEHRAIREADLTGFGDAVPLAFALRQIVPPRFHVDLAEGADDSVTINWKGGRPWRQTLDEALRPVGLASSVSGATVTIAPAQEAAPQNTAQKP